MRHDLFAQCVHIAIIVMTAGHFDDLFVFYGELRKGKFFFIVTNDKNYWLANLVDLGRDAFA